MPWRLAGRPKFVVVRLRLVCRSTRSRGEQVYRDDDLSVSVVQVWPEGWLAGAQDATVKNVVCGRAWSISDSRERIGAEDSRWNNVRSSGRVVWSTLSQHWEHWADHQARVQARTRVEKRGCRDKRGRGERNFGSGARVITRPALQCHAHM